MPVPVAPRRHGASDPRALRAHRRLGVVAAVAVLGGALAASPAAADGTYLGGLPTEAPGVSTVPANGDLNPYGTAVVPRSTRRLHRRDVLVSNFNAASNAQGTGTTIVAIRRDGTQRLFSRLDPATLPGACPGGVGLTTALSVLRGGFVVVGSLPTADGTSATAQAGCLIVLDASGKPVETIAGGPIDGPWDMTALDRGRRVSLFVTNVLDGTVAARGATVDRGTVVRVDLRLGGRGGAPRVRSETVVASGFPQRTDPDALVIGPTGVALGEHGRLYVADALGNAIAAIPDAAHRSDSAGTGSRLTSGGLLNDPLGLDVAPGGDVITANGADGLLVETSPRGDQVAHRDTGAGGGGLFGLAALPDRLWFVNDAANTLQALTG